MSEFAETNAQNMEILKDEHMKYIDASKFDEMSQEIKPLVNALNRFNNNRNSKEKKTIRHLPRKTTSKPSCLFFMTLTIRLTRQ